MDQFCGSCGTKRVEEGRFCFECGKAFAAGTGRPPWVILGILVIATTVVYAVIQFRILPQRSISSAPHGQPSAANSAQAASDHSSAEHLDELRSQAETGDPAVIMELVQHLLESEHDAETNLPEAITYLERLIEKYPDFAYGWRLLGNLYFQSRDIERAAVTYGRYLEIMPDDPNVRTDFGTVLLGLGRVDDAVAQYERALALAPEIYHANFNLALLYRNQGKEELAGKYRARADEIEAKGGKDTALQLDLPRLPKAGSGSSRQTSGQKGPLAELEIFFRKHEIVGPKMIDFQVRGKKVLLLVHNFPMEQMPPFARNAFDQKVQAQLDKVGDAFELEIHDADNHSLLASYRQR